MDDLIGKHIGPYEIRDLIGQGGMAAVYRAYQTSLNRYVAIKVLPGWLAQDQQFVARFRQEALAAGGLRHPNILHIHDAGTFEGRHFIVMDYVPGGTLADRLRRGPLLPDAAAELTAQIADALDHMHQRGVVHRDLKPTNVLLDEGGRPLLADFGIAQAISSGPRLTQTGTSLGTPEYMSPEQAEGSRVDGRSDIYSLGVMLYQMLTGRVPFSANTPLATLYQVIHQPPPPIRQVNPAVPPYLETVLTKALAKRAEQRYQNAREMAIALQQGPGKAAAGRPQTRSRRSGLVYTLFAVLTLIVVVGLAVGASTLLSRRPAATPEAMIALSALAPTVGASLTPTMLPPTATATPVVLVVEKVVTATPAPSPTPEPPTQTPVFVVVTATPPPLPTATVAKATATKAKPTGPAPTRPPTAPVAPGTVADFETFGVWARGNEPYGTFVRVTDRKHGGNAAAQLTYDFPSVSNNYVVFQARPPIAVAGRPQGMSIWVYGDGAGHFLNVWIQDSQGEVRQFTFGRISHADAWQQMTLALDTSAPWPQAHISGPDNGQLDYPVRLYALVLDGVPDGSASRGAIVLDDLMAGDVAPAPVPTTAAGAPAAPEAPAAVPASSPLAGQIVYAASAGGTTDIVVLDVASRNTRKLVASGRQPDIRGDKRVVFNGIGGGKDNLFAINLDGSIEVMTGRHPEDSYPHWSPSGQSAVFHSTLQGDGKQRIYVQWDMTHAEEPVPFAFNQQTVFGAYPTWLETWQIAFTGCNYWASGSNCGIWAINSNGGGQPQQLTSQPGDRSTDSAAGRLLFSSQATGNWDVYVVPNVGGEPRNLTNSPSQDCGATFSPDASRIAFMSDRDGAWGIWVMTAGGDAPQKLIAVPGGFGSAWMEERLAWGP